MKVAYSPFDVLGLSREAEPPLIAAAYKALVWQYHPDANPDLDPLQANRVMAQLNWAMEELERDLPGWRQKAPRRRMRRPLFRRIARPKSEWTLSNALAIRELVEVTPHSVWLNEENDSAILTVRALGIRPEEIRVRFGRSLALSRLPPDGTRAIFQVMAGQALSDEFGVERLEILAPGLPSRRVYVMIKRSWKRGGSWGGLSGTKEHSGEATWLQQRLESVDRLVRGSR